MHSAYINNQGTFLLFFFFFFRLPSARAGFIHALTARGCLWKFRETFPARTWSPLIFLFFLFWRIGEKKSVNIFPRIHIAYSVTLEKLTVYPLKNNVYEIFHRSFGSLTRAREGEGEKEGGNFSKRELNLHGSTRRLFREGNCFFFAISRKRVRLCRSILSSLPGDHLTRSMVEIRKVYSRSNGWQSTLHDEGAFPWKTNRLLGTGCSARDIK